MTWQIQFCNCLTVSRELTLLRESTQKENESSLIEHHAMSVNDSVGHRRCKDMPVTVSWLGKYLNSFVIVLQSVEG